MSNEYDAIIRGASEAYRVPFPWIKAIIGVESSFKETAYRAEPEINDASYGLMQLLYSTAKGLGYSGPPEGLYVPVTNITLGTKYMRDIIDRWKIDVNASDAFARLYSAYNSGSPGKYLTSTQVATHVKNALAWLARVGTESGGAAALLIGIVILYFLFGGKK